MKKWQIHQPSEEAAKQVQGQESRYVHAVCTGSGGTRYA